MSPKKVKKRKKSYYEDIWEHKDAGMSRRGAERGPAMRGTKYKFPFSRDAKIDINEYFGADDGN